MELPEQQRYNTEELRGQLRELIAKGDDPHFQGINLDLVKDEDIEMYGKFFYGTLSLKEITAWSREIFATEAERPKAVTDQLVVKDHSDRGNFAAWMANRFAELQLQQMVQDKKV